MQELHAIKPFAAYRTTFAPVQRAQLEGLKAWGQLARFQCTIAGDLLEHNLAGVRAMMSAASPAEYLARQGQLNARFVDRVTNHTREFLQEAADRSAAEFTASTELASAGEEEEIIDTDEVLSSSAEEEILHMEEEEKEAEQLEQGDIYDEPSVESIEAQPAESSKAKPIAAKQGKKRSDKSRRGQAHH